MKQLIGIFIIISMVTGASAQKNVIAQPVRPSASPKVIVVRPYNPWYSPYYGFNRWGYDPFGYYSYFGWRSAANTNTPPSALDLNIEQIRNDFGHEISTVRHDDNLTKGEKKQKIRDLKHERKNAIISAKQEYYLDKKEKY